MLVRSRHCEDRVNQHGRATDIDVRSRSTCFKQLRKGIGRRADLSLPSLDAIGLHGAGNVSVSGVHGASLAVALPGSGNIDASGTTSKLEVTIGGAGNAFLQRLVARDANLRPNHRSIVGRRRVSEVWARLNSSKTTRRSS